jgi:phosphomannomutase
MPRIESRPDVLDRHLRAVVDALGVLPTAGGRRLKVALDSCNGAGSLVTPRLIEALGAEVVTIHTTPDGSFPRGAEPTPENLSALCDLVRSSNADVGFAQDMDADRLAIVSELGEPIGEELTLVLAVQRVLARTPGTVVTNLSTTHRLDVVTGRAGCRVVRTAVGEANVAEGMQREDAIIGGEGNGGVIYPAINFGRDSLVGIGLVLHLLADAREPLSSLVAALPASSMVKAQTPCPSQRVADVLRRVRQVYAEYQLDLRDGVKVTLGEAWFHVRGSNTEPIIRVVSEAPTAAAARALAAEVFELVGSMI